MKSLQIENAALREDLQNVMITLQRNQNAMHIRQMQQQQMIKQMNTKNRLLSLIQLIKSLTPLADIKQSNTSSEQTSSGKFMKFSKLRDALGMGSSVNASSYSLLSIMTKNQNLYADEFCEGTGGDKQKIDDIMSKSINDIIYELQRTIESFLTSLENKQKMREELQTRMIQNLKDSNQKEVLKLKSDHAEKVALMVQKVREEEKLIVQDELSQLINQNQRLTYATINDSQKDTADMFLLRIDNDNLRAQIRANQREYQDAVNILKKNSQDAKLTLQSDFQQKLLLTQNELQSKLQKEHEQILQDERKKHQSQLDKIKQKMANMQEEINLFRKQASQSTQQKLRYAQQKIEQKSIQQEQQRQFTKKMHKQQIEEIKKVHDRINSELQLKLIQVQKESSLKIEKAKIDTRMQEERSRLDLVQQLQSLKRSQMKYLQNNNKLAANKLFSQVERMQKLIDQIASNFFNTENADALISREFFESDVQKIRNGLNNLSAKVHNQYSKQKVMQSNSILRDDIDAQQEDYLSNENQQILNNQMQNVQQLGMRGRSREKISSNKRNAVSVSRSKQRERNNSIFRIQAEGKFTNNNDTILSKPSHSQAIMIQNGDANRSLLSYNPLLSTKSYNNQQIGQENKKSFSKTLPHQIPPSSSSYLTNSKSTQPKLQPISQNVIDGGNLRIRQELKQLKCIRCGMLKSDQFSGKSFPQIKCKFHPYRLNIGTNKFLHTAQWNYCRENCSPNTQQGCLQIHSHYYEDQVFKQNRPHAIEQAQSQTPQKVQAKSLNYQQQKKLKPFDVGPLKQSLVITQKQERRKKDSPHQDITLATNDDSISNFSDIRCQYRPLEVNIQQQHQAKLKTNARGRSVRSSIQSHKGKIKQQLKSVQRRIQQLNQSSVQIDNCNQQTLYKSINSNMSNLAKFKISSKDADVLSPREFVVSPRENQIGLASQRSKKSMTFAGDQMSNRLNENQFLS